MGTQRLGLAYHDVSIARVSRPRRFLGRLRGAPVAVLRNVASEAGDNNIEELANNLDAASRKRPEPHGPPEPSEAALIGLMKKYRAVYMCIYLMI
jgi:hypothetical protein